MTTASEIIKRAYREANLLGIRATLTTEQQTEGLDLLNMLLPASLANEIGTEIADLDIGGNYDQSAFAADYVPANARIILNLTEAKTLKAHPQPYDGQRLAMADAAANLATYNLTIDGNGRRIEGAASVTLSTDGEAREWIYRADLGEWKKLSSLALSDAMPYPTEFDDYFAMLLAMRLNPRHGQEMQAGSAVWLDKMATRLEARYRKPRPLQDSGSLGLLHQGAATFGSSAAFNRGRAW